MQNVTEDRNLYLGGSDIAAVLNISKFKTRWQLLKEKAGIEPPTFEGNKYTEYGNILEPQIRDEVNRYFRLNFVEDKIIDNWKRYHSDGTDKEAKMVLEIKTTSQIHDKVSDYDYYICQLLFGLQLYGYEKGLLAVYDRPEDFDTEFNPDRLTVYGVHIDNYKEFLDRINTEVEKFRIDWLKLLENPFITEEELLPTDLTEYANKIIELENTLSIMKSIEEECKEVKAKLKEAMELNNIKKWETPNGTKITLVPDGESTIVDKFNEKAFKAEHEELYQQYVTPTEKKGRAGYVRITVK